ncbi:hypothetical protein GCM10007301_54970 [Azorhizobium oxalatiphilum]|uniref:Alpha/beta hydrolase n=1 Tax=Azorhizobium oxalatiphilum TaxID=980631 RepID=A0A917FJS1_9HYPH|nr:hypothetical protein [Azorhizobium oxalatiphilum]GGF88042.1 hypothetical protein GCM10007301_54970 [Azorhizobium oxalatiphilum]
MRTMSYAALALVAGLAFSGAASADEYVSQANRDNYAVLAQSAPAATVYRTNESLLPLTAAPTARTARPASANDQIVGPFSDKDAHSGPSHSGIPSRL